MSNEFTSFEDWVFFENCTIPKEIDEILVAGEVAQAAYKTVRDVAVFTNKRLIVHDTEGIRGKKKEVSSLPWKSVDMWSVEDAGVMDLDSVFKLWTKAGCTKIKIRQNTDVRALELLIAGNIL